MSRTALLFINIFVVAMCGLVYELLAGALASFTLGDSVTQFSLIIGIYLSALGVGAWLSSFVEKGLARTFIEIELGVALLGGLSAPMLYLGFAHLTWFLGLLYGTVFVIGVLVGLELPLLMRILEQEVQFKDLVSRALAFDYIGALVASLAFPLFLVPHLGLVRTSLVFGIANALVGLWGTYLLEPHLKGSVGALRLRAIIVIAVLVAGTIKAPWLTRLAEVDLYSDTIVYAETSAYQRIVVTSDQTDFRLYLNGSLQFSSRDEYRYHEALVHPALALVPAARRVLILGGGDGLALREVLRYPSVEHVTLVDLDPAMTTLGKDFWPLAELNGGSMSDPRLRIVNADAFVWLEQPERGEDPERPRIPLYDAAIIDFPDPNSYSLGKLYTTRFQELLWRRLQPEAALGMQCTSPLFSRTAYWCIIETLRAGGHSVVWYQATVPSFGVWGFALVKRAQFELPDKAPAGLRFLTDGTMRSLFAMPADMSPVPVEINQLNDQVLVRYYEDEWRTWY